MPERGRAHQAAPDREPVAAGGLGGALPVPARGAGRGVPNAQVAAAEAARLLGFPEITRAHLEQFQRQYGQAASRDGETARSTSSSRSTRMTVLDGFQASDADVWDVVEPLLCQPTR